MARSRRKRSGDREGLRQLNEELHQRVLHRTAELLHANEAWQAELAERRRLESQLGHLATHDPLTECFTRHVLEEQLKRQLAHARRYGACGALLFLNVDQFKDINSSLGHVAGDQLLTSLAGLLRERVRGTDCLARVGGDTFAILLPQTDGQQAGIVAEHLLQRVQGHSIVIAGQPLSVTARIGLVVFPDHGTTVGRCLARAESALGRAKEQGRN
ncbi:MAG TPA: diguanylate cyclase, partial [Candidatus Methylomirabilis sp.]|nr:diguanylate cyclase [Candidatus Methylomirabilis sp.]